MEPIAENRFTLTKKLFHEGMEHVVKMNNGKVANRGALALLIVMAAMAVVMILMKQHPAVIILEAVMLFLAALWIKVFWPWQKAQAAWKQIKSRNGEEMERTTSFFFDYLTVQAAGRETKVNYRDIEQIFSTENLLIFVAKDRTGILVKRDDFVKGDEAGVLEMIYRFM